MLKLANYTDSDNILYFANDDDFAKFCINPEIQVYKVINPDGVEFLRADYDFTQQYKDAVANGTRFCIQDLASHVNKDGLLGYRSTTKAIDNIERYYGED